MALIKTLIKNNPCYLTRFSKYRK